TFAATLQPLFFVSGALSLLFKELGAEQSIFATAPVMLWPLCLVALVVGIATGSKLSRYIPLERAHKLSLLMATLGAGVVMLRGAMQTFGG
ncbi:MAG: permease, partial [Corynebacterium urealyticum]